MLRFERERLAWAAGLLSGLGELKIPHRGKPRLVLLLASSRHPEAVQQFADMFGHSLILVNNRLTLRVAGDDLDKLMARLWPYITEERRVEYNDLVTLQRERINAWGQEKRQKALDKKYWEGRPSLTPDQRRQRRELDYHNQDPAVEVLPDEEVAELVTDAEVELDKLRRKLEAEQQRAEMPWVAFTEEN